MDLSDSSSLSSPPSSDDDSRKPIKTLALKKGKLTASAPSRKRNASPSPSPERSPTQPHREPSPPHDYVLADNPDIAIIVMFRSRFAEAFPKNVPNFGPQDIEIGVAGTEPNELAENLLCVLLGLVLNRKKFVERGHHGRALEEAIQTQRSQWPTSWAGINPLHGSRSFSTMDATERLTLLKTLVVWSLNTSELIGGMIKESYKQSRHDDDVNQIRAVQPWGFDGRKRRYWLIEGQADTYFRLYRENPLKLVNRTWWSVAGTIDELKAVAEGLRAEGSQAARRLADKFMTAVPRLEACEEKRKRSEYRKARRAAFTRPEPGFSLYEGRTRGKRLKYTFSDDEDDGSDATSIRRSTRNSNRSTPAVVTGPTTTSSGRQIRSRFGHSYGDPMQDSGAASRTQGSSENDSEAPSRLRGGDTGLRRSGRGRSTNLRVISRRDKYDSADELDDEDEAPSSADQWDGDDDDIEGKLDDEDDDEEISDDESIASPLNDEPQTLVVHLKYAKREGPATDLGAYLNGIAAVPKPLENGTDILGTQAVGPTAYNAIPTPAPEFSIHFQKDQHHYSSSPLKPADLPQSGPTPPSNFHLSPKSPVPTQYQKHAQPPPLHPTLPPRGPMSHSGLEQQCAPPNHASHHATGDSHQQTSEAHMRQGYFAPQQPLPASGYVNTNGTQYPQYTQPLSSSAPTQYPYPTSTSTTGIL